MPAFHDIRFPTDISLRSSGGPERLTRIVTLASGHEERNTPWASARRRYDAGYGLRSIDDIHAVIAFFEARMGRLHGFRWKDWTDFRSCPPSQTPSPLDQHIGIGDGATLTFQLIKTYASGDAATAREITKPVVGTVTIALDGVATPHTLDAPTGRVTLATAPASGAQITAGFEFDTPIRFDTDRLDIDLSGFTAGAIPSIPLIEIRA